VTRTELAVLGESFEDLVFFGLPRVPRPGEELKTDRFMRTVGGGAVITGMAAARMGLRTEVVSAFSPAARRTLQAARIAVRDLRRASEAHAVTVAISTAADRTFVTFGGVNDVLEPRLLAAAARVRARHAHFALFPADCRRWAAAAERLGRRGVTTSVDFGWDDRLQRHRGFRQLLATVDYVFLNQQEALLYSGARRLDRAFAYWKRHTRNVVVKLGARGSRWLSARLDLTVRPPRVRAVDTTGAGDAFNGGFLYGVLRGHPPERCLEIANFVGAMSTRAAGGIAGLPAAEDLR
jgi:sugar/nucleoside kinase (ribokinase family)